MSINSSILNVRPESIPIQLQEIPQWVMWRLVQRDGTPTKVPYATSGSLARPNAPNLCCRFDDVCSTLATGEYNGIGFVFGPDNGLTGVDLDMCRNPDTDALEPWARFIIEWFDTYTEVSPSGYGVKLFLRGSLPENGKKFVLRDGDPGTKLPAVEMYDTGRYFTVTGHHLSGTPAEPQERQNELTTLYEDQIALRDFRKSDDAVKELIGGNHGAYSTDESAADFSLINRMLHRWGRKLDIVERRFKQTGLYRPAKHDSMRGSQTQLRMDIEHAAESVSDKSTPVRKRSEGKEKPPRLPKEMVTMLDTVTPQPVEWLWKPYLPLGKLSSIEGEPGVGKSTMALDLCARITAGKPFPYQSEVPRDPAPVLYCQREDGLADTMVPPIEAAGGDRSRIAVVSASGLTMEEIAACIAHVKPLLVILDPV